MEVLDKMNPPQDKKITANKGVCDLRWNCKNINKPCCDKNIIPKEDGYVYCEHYKEKIVKK